VFKSSVFFLTSALLFGQSFAAPSVSNVRVTVTSAAKVGNFWNWNLEVTFDLANSNGKTCRIWPGIKVRDQGYWMYWNLSGDTAATAGSDRVIRFMVKDTGFLSPCQVRVTAWDSDNWPPLPNKPFFAKYHHWEMDIRQAPKFIYSDSVTAYCKKVMENLAGAEVVGIIGGFGMPMYRVMGNHPLELGEPIPRVSSGDPFGVASWKCSGGDNHMQIIDVENWVLHEMFQFCIPDSGATWQSTVTKDYDMNVEKYAYVSGSLAGYYAYGTPTVDAAGLQLAPGILKIDDIAEGEINHALRFTAGADFLGGQTVYPAIAHDGNASGRYCVNEGNRWRLKQDINLDTRFPLHGTPGSAEYKASQTARIILKCLQQYGMICADRLFPNTILFDAETDSHTELKWADYGGNSVLTSVIYYLPSCLEFEEVDPAWCLRQYNAYAALLP
jgi:hypothetical protein